MHTEPGSVPALARRAVDLVTTALMSLDDSSGAVGDDLHELMAVHAQACALAPPDLTRLAGWLATLRLDGPGWPDFELRDDQTALGNNGRDALRAGRILIQESLVTPPLEQEHSRSEEWSCVAFKCGQLL